MHSLLHIVIMLLYELHQQKQKQQHTPWESRWNENTSLLTYSKTRKYEARGNTCVVDNVE